MTRAPLFLALLGAAALLGGCTRTEPTRAALALPPPPTLAEPAPPPAVRTAQAARGRAAVPPLPPPPAEAATPLPLTAPRPGETYASPPPTAAQRDQAAIVAACRQQAERTILERDRGQILREEEQAARLGASTSVADSRFTSDRLGRVFARDRLAEDCVDANRPLPPRR